MLKLFKFFIWVGVIITIAYFMSDIRIQDKTIKQHIDSFIQKNKTALKIKNKMVEMLGKNKITSQLVEEEEREPVKYNEEITAEDDEALKKVIKQEEEEEDSD